MSVNDAAGTPDRRLADLPTFDLCYGVDDANVPTTVTVYSEYVDEVDTQWITMDAAWAIDLADVA